MEPRLNSAQDDGLFDRLRQGDESAFASIYKLYWAELYNAAYKRLPEKEKCEDVIQNVFTDLWNRRESLYLDHPQAYLHTAVRFQVLKYLSKTSKNNSFTDLFDKQLISPLQTDSVLLEREAKNLISLFIKALPEKRRRIFLMHYHEGLTTAQISVELKVSQKTVQNQLTTATHALRFKLSHLFAVLLALLYTFFN